MSNITVEYLAGLFDGEGSVSIASRNKKNSQGDTKLFHGHISISNSHCGVLEEAKEFFGFGSVSTPRLTSEISKIPTACYCVSHKNAYLFAKQILPFTRIKTKELEVFIEFYETTINKFRSKWNNEKKLRKDKERIELSELYKLKLKETRYAFAKI